MSTHGIAVAAGASPTVLLDSVTIATELAGAPFACLKGAGDVTVQLKGKNYLEAGNLGKCGLVAPSDGTLTIEGVEAGASLEAIGSVLNAGIGASGASGASGGDSACSSIVIQNAKVTARGGMMAAGIGSGYAGSGFSTVSDIIIRNSTVVAEGGTTAAGIGSGYGKLGSAASCITVENSDVTATGGAGAPGIGSGYAHTGDSVASDIVIAGGTVAATGGDSLRGGSGATEESVIGGGAGVGSGWAEAGSTTARNIVVSGGTVTATGGADAEGIGSGAGIGSGSALVGASSAAGIRITGGTVVATGGTTTRAGAGPEALPGVGAGSGTTRSAEDNAIAPAEGLWANAWKGASVDGAKQFVANASQASDLAGVEDAYMKAVLTPAGEQGGADDGTQGDAATKPLVGGSDATVLAATGDNALLPGAVLALALGALAALVLASGAARFPRRGKNAGRSLR